MNKRNENINLAKNLNKAQIYSFPYLTPQEFLSGTKILY